MKKFIRFESVVRQMVCLGILILSLSANGQEDQMKRFYEIYSKELKVGDKMPDIPLGTVSNNYTGKTRFSEFKNKLVILDYWTVNCTVCIENFPKMSKLQEKYKDKIQIFLVNYSQTQAQIEALPIIYKKIPANIPSITDAKSLEELFPSYGETGYHVWIDGNSIIRLRGPGVPNTYNEKIEDLLNGKQIEFITDIPLKRPGFNFKPLPKLGDLLNRKQVKSEYSSIFSNFSDSIRYSGQFDSDIVDSIQGTIRTTIGNETILHLYTNAVAKMAPSIVDERKSQILITDYDYRLRSSVKLYVKDTFQYLKPRKGANDKWYRKSLFCYEQIVPLAMSDSLRGAFMFQDLNRFFGIKFGIKGSIEKLKTQCFVLVKSKNNQDKNQNTIQTVSQNLDSKNLYVGQVKGLLSKYFKLFPKDVLLLDESGKNQPITIKLPEKISSIDDLKRLLQSVGYDIISTIRERRFLVINESTGNQDLHQ